MATWSGIRKKLEKEYLEDSLKGRISYYSTSFSYAPDHVGRAAIRLDGEEVLKSDYAKLQKLQWESYQEIKNNMGEFNMSDAWSKSWDEAVRKGGFDNQCFYNAFDEYGNQSIEISLQSRNALVRIFAVLDRRVGKRRLKEIFKSWKNEQEWIVFFP